MHCWSWVRHACSRTPDCALLARRSPLSEVVVLRIMSFPACCSSIVYKKCASVAADMATAHTAAAVTAAGAPIESTAPASAGMASSRAPTSPVSAARGEQIENENTSFCTDCAFLISATHAPHNRYAGVNALNAAAKYLARGSRVVVVDRNGKWGGQWVGQYEYVH